MTSWQILEPEEYISRHKKAFRTAFDYLNAHFPPVVNDEYWIQGAQDAGQASDPENPLLEELLCAIYAYLEKEYKIRRDQNGETQDRNDGQRSQRNEDDDD